MGYKKLLIVTIDTDGIAFVLYAHWELDIKNPWAELSEWNNCRWFPIHLIAGNLGEQICRDVMFWYTLTGCDTAY